MSQGNIEFELQNGLFTFPTTSVPVILEKIEDASGNSLALRCYGTTAITDGTGGFATGCTFQNISGGNGTSIYVNESDTLNSCDFNAITVT